MGSAELVAHIPFVFNHPLISERRTVETVLDTNRRLQLVQVIVFWTEMASATTAAPALFHTLVSSELTAW